MALTKSEKLLVEAIQSMLHQDSKLGLSFHDKEFQSAERGYEYLHGQIDEMFAIKAAELVHSEGVCQAFSKVHNYKYLDDPTFHKAMERELVAQAVPAEERRKALDFVPAIINELKEENSEWNEKDSGFNPKLDEIKKVSQPEQDLDFTIHDSPLNKQNVDKSVHGDGSPARTSMTQPPLPS